MRSALLASFLFLALSAGAQINPATNIQWPQPSCGTSGNTYSPKDNLCIPSGGGGGGGGGLPIANPQFLGTMQGPAISSSVNSQINVMAPPYNAKGDCVTDDHNAIQAALEDAMVGIDGTASRSPILVVFPTPPGLCYLTSTLTWRGQSLKGQGPFGSRPIMKSAGVIIRGMPGQDILHVPDPNTQTKPAALSWNIEDLVLQPDTSVDASASFPHRWPGRWSGDGAMTAGSPLLTSGYTGFTCGDVGQAILVKGAGAGGADLVTTITATTKACNLINVANASPSVTLAANAGTTVSNALVYISIADIPVTRKIGNCAIGADNMDGDRTHWAFPSGGAQFIYPIIKNVWISATASNPNNNTCAMFFQNTWEPYGIDVQNFSFENVTYGVVEGFSDVNPDQGWRAGQDFQKFMHGWWGAVYPWISYGGSDFTLEDIQLASNDGPQIIGNYGWTIRIPEMELGTGLGFRILGFGTKIDTTALCGTTNTGGILELSYSTISTSSCYGNAYIYGRSNHIDFSTGWVDGIAIHDQGSDNNVIGGYYANPLYAYPASPKIALNKTRGDYTSRVLSPDFIVNGDAATPFPNMKDLFLFPDDMFNGFYTYGTDSNSFTGRYFDPGGNGYQVPNFYNQLNQTIVIGDAVPAAKVTMSVGVWCNPVGSYSLDLVIDGSGVVSGTPFSCGTSSYTTGSATFDLAPYNGHTLGYKITGYSGWTQVKIGWFAVRPFMNDLNGMGFAPGGQSIVTGPNSSGVGNVATYQNVNGGIGDSGVLLSSLAPLNNPIFTGSVTLPITGTTQCVQVDASGHTSGTGTLCGAGGGGGMTNPMTTQGDVIVGGASGTPQRLAAGTNAYVLTSNGPGNIPSWQSAAVGAASPLTGWYDMVAQGGIDNTGATDVSSAILTIINGLNNSNPKTLYFGPGTYNINAGILISATGTTKSGIRMVGAGRDSTIFTSTCSNGYMIWYNNTAASADNFAGAMISDVQFQDTSGSHNACLDVLKLTQTAENVIERIKIRDARGNTYNAGTISISGSTVTGSGTTWTAAMAPGVLQVNGVMAEVCQFNSSTSLTLCSNNWPKGSISSGTSYALAYGGRGLTFDPGNSFTQYISVHDYFGMNDMFCIYSMGSNNGSNGNSRITVDGKAGWCGASGLRIANAVGVWLGRHSDTFKIDIPVNNMTRCAVLESAHANNLDGFDCENNSSQAIVTTCNGGVASQNCVFGFELNADATSSGYANAISNPYVYLAGTAFVTDNTNGEYNLSISGLRSASFSNNNSYNFHGTTGCPASSSGIAVTINNWDCVHTQLSVTVGLFEAQIRWGLLILVIVLIVLGIVLMRRRQRL